MTWGTPLFCESGGGKWIIYRRREARRQNKLLTKRIKAYVGKSLVGEKGFGVIRTVTG